MATLWCTFAIFFHLWQHAQQQRSYFIEPNEISPIEDIFIYQHLEYVFVETMVDYSAARTMCKHKYFGRLAHVKTAEVANFLAEALSETNLNIAVIWIGGEFKTNSWYWTEDDKEPIRISPAIIQLYVNYSQSIQTNDRECLAIGREGHLKPLFSAFSCRVSRSYMCERPSLGVMNSTHTGWIIANNFLYKIFAEKLSWEEADAKCFVHDNRSSLAFVPNNAIAKQLAKYLLIGRPSLERAWIGASLIDNVYQFGKENVILSSERDASGYPPWPNKPIGKRDGCILLDRHLSKNVYFSDARCKSPRAYICYMNLRSGDALMLDDIFIDEFGYRVFLKTLSWENAIDKCNYYKPKYQAKLVEIREKRIVNHLLYIMGENKTSLNHIWLGGMYNLKTKTWNWHSDNSPIQIDGVLDWVKNDTYMEELEQIYICLNMDRENYIHALHYGSDCRYKQNYICVFPREKLIQLQEDEAQE